MLQKIKEYKEKLHYYILPSRLAKINKLMPFYCRQMCKETGNLKYSVGSNVHWQSVSEGSLTPSSKILITRPIPSNSICRHLCLLRYFQIQLLENLLKLNQIIKITYWHNQGKVHSQFRLQAVSVKTNIVSLRTLGFTHLQASAFCLGQRPYCSQNGCKQKLR